MHAVHLGIVEKIIPSVFNGFFKFEKYYPVLSKFENFLSVNFEEKKNYGKAHTYYSGFFMVIDIKTFFPKKHILVTCLFPFVLHKKFIKIRIFTESINQSRND